ncbi:MAG: ABC transporter permease [Atopobiaceae bacterium]|nr:ABC transporter permease [Atopobiaceae bacterium]
MKQFEKFLRSRFAAALLAVLVGFIVSAIVLAIAGYNPIQAFAALFKGAFGRPKYVANTIIKATPILLTGVSVAFAFKTGLFNIGAEGQYIVGTVLATIVGVKLNLPMPVQIPVVLLSGIVGGAALGSFVGWLKAKFGIHEVITSIMCNWIAFYLCNYVVMSDTFHKPNSSSALAVNPSSYTMILGTWKKSAAGKEFLAGVPWLREVLLKTDLNAGFIIAIIVAILASIVLTRTKLGYELRAVGFNRDAARFSGISVERNIVLSMLISGGICGLAGALSITGTSPHTITLLAAMESYGFNGMSVAFIAACSPLGCIPSSILFSALIYGGMSVQQVMGAPSDIINIMIGTIVFVTALPGIAPLLADMVAKKRRAEENVRVSKDGTPLPEKEA